MNLSSLGGAELSNIASLLQQPAENFGNDPTVEMMWAVKAYEHAETYFNIIVSVDPKLLRLCPLDNDIYTKFRETFPDMQLELLDEEIIKSSEGKEKWREFCCQFEGQVADWNMATLVRLDCKKDISEDNTTIVPRIQFLAFEIARNREGLNDDLRKNFSPKKSRKS